MYDLPTQSLNESGFTDEFHRLQPQLLSFTFRPSYYPPQRVFAASEMNLYYDVHHQNWFKKPDWFVVVGVPRLYDEQDLRLSYVIWQEGISPFVVVELLSSSTEQEDLGQTTAATDQPPTKLEVYERILRVPYYVVLNPKNNQLRAFILTGGHYQELNLTEPRIWMPELELGLDLWPGEYQGINRSWLRWYDAQGNWIPTDAEAAQKQAQAERQRAEEAENRAKLAEQRIEYLTQKLRELGAEP